MMRTVALLLACVALAAAVPTDHKVNHVTSAKHISNHENAKQALKMLQAKGTDASACRELSETTKKEVEDGANCHTEGQTAVDDATNAKSLADQAHLDAVAALAAANAHSVVFEDRAFNSLTEGECSYFFGSDAYIAAKATHTAAVADESAAAGAATSAATALDETSTADCAVTVPTCTPRTLPAEVSGASMCGMT